MNGAGPRPLFELRATAGGVRSWLARQLQAVIATLGAMARTPLATAMTVAVVAAALALPAALQMVLVNIDQAVSGWGTQARVSLYLRPSVEDDTARALARRLEALPDVDRAVLTTRADALAEYERMVGLEGVASLLGEDNPLPAVLDVIPRGEGADSARIKALGRILGQLREVEMVRVDLDWVRRLEGLLGLTERALWLLGGFLAVAVVLVVGNTLRLAVDGRREEIAVIRAFGGTDAFIRRPFLYGGGTVGLIGGLCAWLAVLGACAYLDGPTSRLASAYQSEYTLTWPDASIGLVLAGAGTALGLVGAFLAVGRHLRSLDAA